MNEPIKKSYYHASAVVVQSKFDKDFIFRFFGERENVHIIHNGTDINMINNIDPHFDNSIFPREKIWMCASSWRPHKRLDENIRLFQHLRGPNDKLVVAGKDAKPGYYTDVSNVQFLGDLTWPSMISWMKSAGHFIHLAWLDHCPNVVIDAKAAGCKLHVAEAGGTKELVGKGDFVYKDQEFDFNIVSLYEPPTMTFSRLTEFSNKDDFSISASSKKYIEVIERL